MDKDQVKGLVSDVLDFAAKEANLIPVFGSMASSAIVHVKTWLMDEENFDKLYEQLIPKMQKRGMTLQPPE